MNFANYHGRRRSRANGHMRVDRPLAVTGPPYIEIERLMSSQQRGLPDLEMLRGGQTLS